MASLPTTVHSTAHISTICGLRWETTHPHLWTDLWTVKWMQGLNLWRTTQNLVTDDISVIRLLPSEPTQTPKTVHAVIHRRIGQEPSIRALIHSIHRGY